MKDIIAYWDTGRKIPAHVIEKVNESESAGALIFCADLPDDNETVQSTDDNRVSSSEKSAVSTDIKDKSSDKTSKAGRVQAINVTDNQAGVKALYDAVSQGKQIKKLVIVDEDISNDFVFQDPSDIETAIDLHFKQPSSMLRRLLPLLARNKAEQSANLVLLRNDDKAMQVSVLDNYIRQILEVAPIKTIRYKSCFYPQNSNDLLSLLNVNDDGEASIEFCDDDILLTRDEVKDSSESAYFKARAISLASESQSDLTDEISDDDDDSFVPPAKFTQQLEQKKNIADKQDTGNDYSDSPSEESEPGKAESVETDAASETALNTGQEASSETEAVSESESDDKRTNETTGTEKPRVTAKELQEFLSSQKNKNNSTQENATAENKEALLSQLKSFLKRQ